MAVPLRVTVPVPFVNVAEEVSQLPDTSHDPVVMMIELEAPSFMFTSVTLTVPALALKLALPVTVSEDDRTKVAAPVTVRTVALSASVSVVAVKTPVEIVIVPPAAVTPAVAVKLNDPMANVPGNAEVFRVFTIPFTSRGNKVAPELASMKVSVADVGTPAPPDPPLVAAQQNASLQWSPLSVQKRSNCTR